MPLTVEQENIIAIYKRGSRMETVEAISEGMRLVIDRVTKELMLECISDLCELSDEEFSTQRFSLTRFEYLILELVGV